MARAEGNFLLRTDKTKGASAQSQQPDTAHNTCKRIGPGVEEDDRGKNQPRINLSPRVGLHRPYSRIHLSARHDKRWRKPVRLPPEVKPNVLVIQSQVETSLSRHRAHSFAWSFLERP